MISNFHTGAALNGILYSSQRQKQNANIKSLPGLDSEAQG